MLNPRKAMWGPRNAYSSATESESDRSEMPARKPTDPNAKPQIERFREAARELGCDDDEEAFWDKVCGWHDTNRRTIRLRQIANDRASPRDDRFICLF